MTTEPDWVLQVLEGNRRAVDLRFRPYWVNSADEANRRLHVSAAPATWLLNVAPLRSWGRS